MHRKTSAAGNFFERDMRRIEVNRCDRDRRRSKIAQHIAAARGDSDKLLAPLKLQRSEVDDGIFPNLRIDKPTEGKREEPLLDALPGGRIVAMDSLMKPLVAWAANPRFLTGDRILNSGHSIPVYLGWRRSGSHSWTLSRLISGVRLIESYYDFMSHRGPIS